VHLDNKGATVSAPAHLTDQDYLRALQDRTLYKIIETQLTPEDELENAAGAAAADAAHVPNVTAISDAQAIAANSSVQQIIYVYQDPDDPSEPRTLHMMDDVNQGSDEVSSRSGKLQLLV